MKPLMFRGCILVRIDLSPSSQEMELYFCLVLRRALASALMERGAVGLVENLLDSVKPGPVAGGLVAIVHVSNITDGMTAIDAALKEFCLSRLSTLAPFDADAGVFRVFPTGEKIPLDDAFRELQAMKATLLEK